MSQKFIFRLVGIIALININSINVFATGPEKPLIIPIPSEVRLMEGKFSIDKSTFIMLPQEPGKNDNFLAQLILSEFVDKYEQSVALTKRSTFTGKDKFILIGDISNPLVKKFCEEKGLSTSLKGLGNEGYILSVTPENVVVASNTKNGALYGLESLRQIISEEQGKLFIRQLMVKDSPRYPFRGIKLYLPGRENITFFKRFVKENVSTGQNKVTFLGADSGNILGIYVIDCSNFYFPK